MAEINLGRVGLVPRGIYDPDMQYQRQDVVSFSEDGVTSAAYMAVKNSKGNIQTDREFWQPLIELDGVDGVVERLIDLGDDAQTAIQNITNATNNANAKETIRQSNETTRQANESARQSGYTQMETRLDAAIGELTEDSEVLDARVNDIGYTHPTLGAHVRELDTQMASKAPILPRTTPPGQMLQIPAEAGSRVRVWGDGTGDVWHWGGINLRSPGISQGNPAPGGGLGGQAARLSDTYHTYLLPGTYTVSCYPPMQVQVYMYSDTTASAITTSPYTGWVNSPKSFTIASAGYYRCGYRYEDNRNVAPSDLLHTQLEVGSVATPYEPYVGETLPYAPNTPIALTAYGRDTLISNAGDIQAEYIASAAQNIAEKYPQVSDTGPIATVDGLARDMGLDVTVRCVAVQEGTGDASPDNVRAIKKRSVVEATQVGKNLFNLLGAKTASGATWQYINNGIRLISGGASSHRYIRMPLLPAATLVGKTITLQATMIRSATNTMTMAMTWLSPALTSMSPALPALTATGKATVALGTPPDGAAFLGVLLYAARAGDGTVSGDYVDYTNIQLELGETATPFTSCISHTYPLTLPEGKELHGLPDAMDSWDARTGIVTRRTGLSQLTGVETVTKHISTPSAGYTSITVTNATKPRKGPSVVVSNMFVRTGSSLNGIAYECMEMTNAANATVTNFVILVSRLAPYGATDDTSTHPIAFAGWLAAQYAAGTPVQLLYELPTPTYEYVDPVDIRALPGLNTAYSDGGGDTTVTGLQEPVFMAQRVKALEDAFTAM